MVFIIKKLNDDTKESLLKRVSAIMISMEYNRDIYNIEGKVKVNKKTGKYHKPFNVFKYEFFTDTYLYNCGTIIFTDSEYLNAYGKKLIKELEVYTETLDIHKNDIIYKPYSPSKHFMTTQYCIIWKKITENIDRRIITYNLTNSSFIVFFR